MSGWCSTWTSPTPQAPCWTDFWDVDDWARRMNCLEPSSSVSTVSPSQPLSQDVQAAVEEIDSIVNELWRATLPKHQACWNGEPKVLDSVVSESCLSTSPSPDYLDQFLPATVYVQSAEVKEQTCFAGVESQKTDLRTSKPKHKCDKCEKCYIWLNDLVKHKKVHLGKRYICSVCNKSYALKSDLCKHERSHQSDKALQCKECGKSFISSGDLHRHMRIHTGERPYCCNVCNKSFSASDNFRKHLKIHSGDKPLICADCGQRFLKKSNLQQHARIHLGEKPFQCEICGLNFTQKTHLSTHINTHSGLKPFNCTSCNQSFTRNADLKRHISRAHTIKIDNRGL